MGNPKNSSVGGFAKSFEQLLSPTSAMASDFQERAEGQAHSQDAYQQNQNAYNQDLAVKEQGRLATEDTNRRNKINTDYIANYNQGLVDDESMKALEDARASTRRSRGRQINFG